MSKYQRPKVLVLSGVGMNCENETVFAFQKAKFTCIKMHVNTLLENPNRLQEFQVLAFPGGFSYQDSTRSGNVLAIKIATQLMDQLEEFLEKGNLIIGICNGCQTLANLFLKQKLAFTTNFKYTTGWHKLNIARKNDNSPWLRDISSLYMPIAHEGGRCIFNKDLSQTECDELIALKYENNPNNSDYSTSAISYKNDQVLMIMPHPERSFLASQLLQHKVSLDNSGFKIFENAYTFFMD